MNTEERCVTNIYVMPFWVRERFFHEWGINVLCGLSRLWYCTSLTVRCTVKAVSNYCTSYCTLMNTLLWYWTTASYCTGTTELGVIGSSISSKSKLRSTAQYIHYPIHTVPVPELKMEIEPYCMIRYSTRLLRSTVRIEWYSLSGIVL